MRIAKACKYCGSRDIRIDAFAKWNVRTQKWELDQVFDDVHCNKCDGETSIKEVVLTK